jgi:hypothetical protein
MCHGTDALSRNRQGGGPAVGRDAVSGPHPQSLTSSSSDGGSMKTWPGSKPERQVLGNSHMGREGVPLENHCDVGEVT